MVWRNGLTIGVSLLLAGLLLGCGSKPVVGVLLPSTGEAGTYGESIESGIRLALSESRDKGTLPAGFDVVWADTQSSPQLALSELERMAGERGIRLVVGGATSAEAQAIIPQLEELDVVCLSPSASTPASPNSRVCFSGSTLRTSLKATPRPNFYSIGWSRPG